MANSGEIKTNVEYDSWFWVRWSLKSQSIAENYTTIKWSCGVTPGHKFGDNAIKMSAVTINGVQVYGGGKYSDFLDYKEHTLGSGELKIQHDSDGKKTFAISSFTGWLYSNHNYKSGGAKYDLPAIPRQATITAADDFKDVDNPTITYSNPAGNAVEGLAACISLTGAVVDISYRSIPKTGSTYTFPLTDAEREVLRNNTVNERTVVFKVRTTIGGTNYYSVISKKFTVSETEVTKPEVTIDATLNNGTLPSKFDGLYIQGKSRVDLTVYAKGKYGASINSFSATVDKKSHNLGAYEDDDGYKSNTTTSDVIEKYGKVDIVGYAKDSRGFTGSDSVSCDVIEYSKPTISNSAVCYRSDGYGNRVGNSSSLWIKADRSYHTVEGKNTCKLQWRWKLASDDWSNNWKDLLTASDATDEYSGLVQDVWFNPAESYTVQVRAIDDIGEESVKTFDVPTLDVALHLGKGGKNVSIGTYCDYSKDHTFRSAWKAIFDLDINGLYIRTIYVSGTNHIYIKTKYEDFSDAGGNRQSFFIFGTACGIPLNGTGFVSSSGATDWAGTTSIGLTALDDGVLEVTLPSVSYDSFAIISASPFDIVYL